MKLVTVIGLILLVLGIVALGQQGFTYFTRETVADIGPIAVTADREHTVWIPPVIGAFAAAAGVLLILVASKSNSGA